MDKQQAAHLVPTKKTLAGYPLHEGMILIIMFYLFLDVDMMFWPFLLNLFVEETPEILAQLGKPTPIFISSFIFIFSSLTGNWGVDGHGMSFNKKHPFLENIWNTLW